MSSNRTWFPTLLIIIALFNPLTSIAAEKSPRELWAYEIGKIAYVWAYPLISMHNRSMTVHKLPQAYLVAGILPMAPINHLAMLAGTLSTKQNYIVSPSQDFIYGQGWMDLSQGPVVVQVPDFGKRFWVYQFLDQRTDVFASPGSRSKTSAGFYMVVGPDWHGATPQGISKVFRSTTNLAMIIPRVRVDENSANEEKIQSLINQIVMYPLSEYSGKFKKISWAKLPILELKLEGKSEQQWVKPETFISDLDVVLEQVPAMKGERSIYTVIGQVLEESRKDPKIKTQLQKAAMDADRQILASMFDYSKVGRAVGNGWYATIKGGKFGFDYFTRAAVTKSYMLVNIAEEAMYFGVDDDQSGHRLNSKSRYTLTFKPVQLPPVNGFWSLTVYNDKHFYQSNSIGRYTAGTRSKNLHYAADGSLTLYLQSTPPGQDKKSNWLPIPEGKFSCLLRLYGAKPQVIAGNYTPPALVKVGGSL